MDDPTRERLIEFQRRCDVRPIGYHDPRYIDLYSYDRGLLTEDPSSL